MKSKREKTAKEFFDNMTEKEFDNLLKESGFEVGEGDGEIVFADYKVVQGKVNKQHTDYGIRYFIIDDKSLGYIWKDEGMFNYLLEEYENKNIRVTIEVID
ncbi:hypothetical protein [Aquibacillus saliphilus]|uniref:hypothetical protein n=1 Tax=Aquibacillus saliphilus TaxID=1909422 RepID=UPI001CF01622|nr:hypothetical protein [Aquibacillus saliphilus]